MILIDNIYVEKKILTQYFLCDTNICLGACCTFYGEYGAPLKEEEIPLLKEHITITEHLLSEKSKE